jgi:hypothetical protein
LLAVKAVELTNAIVALSSTVGSARGIPGHVLGIPVPRCVHGYTLNHTFADKLQLLRCCRL